MLGFPIQQQRRAVDVQLLAVAGIGSHRQCDSIAHIVAGTIEDNLAIGHFRNIDLNMSGGIHQSERDLHFLSQIALNKQLDPDSSILNTAGIAGSYHLGKIQCANRSVIKEYNGVGALNNHSEIQSVALYPCLLRIGKGVVIRPCGR